MATSGSIDFTTTRNNIINRALRMVGGIDNDGTAQAYQTSNTAQALNSMIKSWQNRHIGAWKIEWRQVAPVAASEVTGTDSLVYTCIKAHTGTANDTPITGLNYTNYWKQMGSTGGVWATSAYTAIGEIELDTDVIGIMEAFWRDGSDDSPITIITREEYMAIGDKGQQGTPSQLYFEDHLTAPKIRLWPQPDVDVSSDLSEALHYSAISRLDDFDAAGNTPDFDQRWHEAITYNLAYAISGEYAMPYREKILLREDAKDLLEEARNGSEELDGMKLSPRVR